MTGHESQSAAPKKKIRCILSANQAEFTIKMSTWKETLPIEQLADQIDFYEKLSDRSGGKYKENYGPVVDALRKLRDRIEGK